VTVVAYAAQQCYARQAVSAKAEAETVLDVIGLGVSSDVI